MISGTPSPDQSLQGTPLLKPVSVQRLPEATRSLPLGDDVPSVTPRGFSFRTRLKREEIQVEKRVVTAEQVVIRLTDVQETARLQAPVSREELRLSTSEGLDIERLPGSRRPTERIDLRERGKPLL